MIITSDNSYHPQAKLEDFETELVDLGVNKHVEYIQWATATLIKLNKDIEKANKDCDRIVAEPKNRFSTIGFGLCSVGLGVLCHFSPKEEEPMVVAAFTVVLIALGIFNMVNTLIGIYTHQRRSDQAFKTLNELTLKKASILHPQITKDEKTWYRFSKIDLEYLNEVLQKLGQKFAMLLPEEKREATGNSIKKIYREVMLRMHPDKTKTNNLTDEQNQLKESLEELKNLEELYPRLVKKMLGKDIILIPEDYPLLKGVSLVIITNRIDAKYFQNFQ